MPPSFAKIDVDLNRLSLGIKISDRSGQATVTAQRVNDSTIIVTATCDSLAREMTILMSELERYKRIEEVKKEPPDVVVKKEPTGLQWLQIWIGRIAVILLTLIAIKRRLKII